MNKQVWIFHEAQTYSAPIHALGLKIKTDVRSARSRLRTLASSQIDVVYHLPWCLPQVGEDEREVLGPWLEFGIEALALKQDYPTRVRLWPLDVFLKSKNADVPPELSDRSGLSAFVLENQYPDIFELLEGLERGGELQERAPLTRSASLKLSRQQVLEVADLLRHSKTIEQEKIVLAQALQEVQAQLAQARAAAGLQALESPNVRQLEQNNARLEEEVKESKQDQLVLLQQLQAVQQDLERVYLESQELKLEAGKATVAMRNSQALLRSRLGAEVMSEEKP